jgi:hypothetical protein
MDDTLAKVEAPATFSGPALSQVNSRFDAKLAQPFIYKSVSEETRAACHRAIREFVSFVGGIHPARVTPADVIAYRDHLRTKGAAWLSFVHALAHSCSNRGPRTRERNTAPRGSRPRMMTSSESGTKR